MTTALTTNPYISEIDARLNADLLHCDKCGALGKLKVSLKNGLDLVFCGHHAHEFEASDKLHEVALTFDLV